MEEAEEAPEQVATLGVGRTAEVDAAAAEAAVVVMTAAMMETSEMPSGCGAMLLPLCEAFESSERRRVAYPLRRIWCPKSRSLQMRQ
eukprot:1263719-Prymnesium_polylepis.1